MMMMSELIKKKEKERLVNASDYFLVIIAIASP